jgi:hypothetical protein
MLVNGDTTRLRSDPTEADIGRDVAVARTLRVTLDPRTLLVVGIARVGAGGRK